MPQLHGTLWFTSDTHFWHRRILELSGRSFPSVEDMNETLIDNWNACVRQRDTVIHLGDFGLGPAELLREVFTRLNGRKHLVRGNHDGPSVLALPWHSIQDYLVQGWQRLQFVLFHFPMEAWWHAERGTALHCHGHVHGGVVPLIPHRWDVGSDPMGFRPVSAERLAYEGIFQSWSGAFDRTRYLL